MSVNHRVLITGGARGIGSAIASRAREDGYEPVIIDRSGSGIIADLSDPDETQRALNEALSDGPIHRLVNNVGAIAVAKLADTTLSDLETTWGINTRAAVQCAQAVSPAMMERGFGRIVNISSRALLGKEGRTSYSASKAALVGLTRTWALEFAAYGITVNSVAPGPIRTEMFDAANPPDAPETRKLVEGIPMRRMGEPDEIANSVSHFLDSRSGFTTGQTLYVCGGKTVGLAGV